MHTFTDENGYSVTMSFEKGAFQAAPAHVLVLCRSRNGWLLTKHRTRGLECPGGKAEAGESLEEAARREAAEETGAVLRDLFFVGEYRVNVPDAPFLKAVFFAYVQRIEQKTTYRETDGPFIETGDLLRERFNPDYSFLMKDDVIALAVAEVKKKGLI